MLFYAGFSFVFSFLIRQAASLQACSNRKQRGRAAWHRETKGSVSRVGSSQPRGGPAASSAKELQFASRIGMRSSHPRTRAQSYKKPNIQEGWVAPFTSTEQKERTGRRRAALGKTGSREHEPSDRSQSPSCLGLGSAPLAPVTFAKAAGFGGGYWFATPSKLPEFCPRGCQLYGLVVEVSGRSREPNRLNKNIPLGLRRAPAEAAGRDFLAHSSRPSVCVSPRASRCASCIRGHASSLLKKGRGRSNTFVV